MDFLSLVFLAVGLSMDALAVAVCKGLSMKTVKAKAVVVVGLWFGGFQALMPVLGFFAGQTFAEAIEKVDHWIAFGILLLIGLNMLREAVFSKEEEAVSADLSVKTMFFMAVATSIDALAVGVSLSFSGGVNIWLAAGLIGAVTFVLSALGVGLGNVFGARFEKKAQCAGGVILILIGLRILLEHLGVL